MASKIGLSYRRETIQQRLDAATRQLAEALAVEPPVVTGVRDPDLRKLAGMDALADFFERAYAAVPSGIAGVEAEAMLVSAYAFYDGDERAHGPDDFAAFAEAVSRAMSGEEPSPETIAEREQRAIAAETAAKELEAKEAETRRIAEESAAADAKRVADEAKAKADAAAAKKAKAGK